MAIAKVFQSKYGQAVRLPKEFRVMGKELDVLRRGHEIVLRERKGTMLRAFELPASLPNDLTIAEHRNDRPQKRDGTRLKKRRKS